MSNLGQNAITNSVFYFNMGLTPPSPLLNNVKKLQIWKRGTPLMSQKAASI